MTAGGAERPVGAPGPARILVTCCNTFQNRGDAVLTLALDAELRRLLPDAQVTYSLRSPRLARAGLPDRRLIAQFITRDTAPGARAAALAARLDRRLVPAVAVLQVQVLFRWVRAWASVDRRSSRLAARLLPGALRTLVREVRAADAVVAAPGGYLLTVTAADIGWIHAAAPLIAARALGVPVMLAAMTIGPIPGVLLPAARLAIGDARLVLLREGHSAPWVERIGVPASRVSLSADMAWLTEPAAELPERVTTALAATPGAGPLVVFAVRDFAFPRAADPAAARIRYLESLAAAADRLVERRAVRVVFVAQVLAPPVTDADVARAVISRMRHAATLVDDPLEVRELTALYARADLVIGVRMHAGILAMAAGTPFVGIAYGIKHTGIMADLGLGRYLTPIDDLDAAWLAQAAEAALDDAPALRTMLAARVPELRARVRTGSERLAAMIGTRSRAPGVPGVGASADHPDRLDSVVMEQGTNTVPVDDRPYSPGLEGVIAGETSIALVDGQNGRLIYRGYPIGDLVKHGTYAQVAELLWTGEWPASAHLACAPLSDRVLGSLRDLPATTHPMDALRTALSVWGAETNPGWPSTVDQARALTALAPTALAAFARLRAGREPIAPRADLGLADGFLYLLNGTEPDSASARALDAYFIVGAEHGFNASTFTARVICATRSDIASAVCGAIGALKGPLHGGAPAEVVNQLNEIGSAEAAAAWIDDALARGERLMGFGHRVYRAYDPRAAALRHVAEQMGNMADWLGLAVAVEDIALAKLAQKSPDRPLKTNVEYYTAAVLQGVGLPPDLFPSVFALARHAGWTAHVLEQNAANKLIRPDVRYIGPAERPLPVATPD